MCVRIVVVREMMIYLNYFFLQDQKTQEAIQEFTNGIDLFYTIAIPPHKNTHIAEESLRSCKADQGTVVPFIKL